MRKWYNNGESEKYSEYPLDGFVLGRLSRKGASQKRVEEFLKIHSVEEVINFYECHSLNDTLSYFNISDKDFRKVIGDYKKPTELKSKPKELSRTHESYVSGGTKSATTQKNNLETLKNKLSDKYGSYDNYISIRSSLAQSGRLANCESGDIKESYSKGIETKKINLAKNGVSWEEFNKRKSDKLKTAWKEMPKDTKEHLLREMAIKASETRSSNIADDGTSLDSSLELLVYNFCIRNNIPISHGIEIPYTYNNEIHYANIDFIIDGINVEVKGSHFLNGVHDDVAKTSYKIPSYIENNVVVITDKEVHIDGLKCVDISLFDSPVFPFREDRPDCFFKVRVNGKKSCYDAFYDEKIRWSMIKNRIKYGGDFISSSDIITALNSTRTAKQPSWFSKNFAKKIISSYCSESTIVDTFAGWGARYDACIELGKDYIGCDLNKELVEWHMKNNRNIKFCDAVDFKYDKKCSVFICPPYGDTEDYNYKEFDKYKSYSECDWLRIVMKNIPNASEYVMVCKNVDKEFEKYIVSEKTNRSHLGTNKEYILKVR